MEKLLSIEGWLGAMGHNYEGRGLGEIGFV